MGDRARSDDPAVQRQLDRLAARSPGQDVLGLERIAELCAALVHPERRLPPTFHVAGTNGKGSTCALLRAALEADGRRVHVYTSPHLVRFNERIRLGGRLIEDRALAPLLAEVLDTCEREGIAASFFEVTTAAALLAFAREEADACVIEVGLGGRLDATNVLPAEVLAACAIAALGIDHESFLLAPEPGTPELPLARIGWEKAGIAKPGVPLVTLAYPAEVRAAVAQQADRAGAPLLAEDEAWRAKSSGTRIHYRDRWGELDLPCPPLPGAHQADNAALAVAALRHQHRLAVDAKAIAAGLPRAHWPARLHRLNPGPLTALAPGHVLWLDGGHNSQAGLALARHFRDTPRLHLILGQLANKDPRAILAPLSDRLASISAVPVPGHDSHPASAFPGARAAPDVATALGRLPDDRLPVLIAGSLYLAGAVLESNGEAPE